MGTWGDGLYDNDSALDLLADHVRIPDDETDPARLAAGIGLLAWLNPVSVTHRPEPLWARVEALGDALLQLPDDTRAALRRLRDDPEAATATRSRSPEAHAAIGGYCDGPRIDALLRFPGAQPPIDELAAATAKRLDQLLAADLDLHEIAGEMVALGILIELTQADLWRPDPARVARWRDGFAAIDKSTKEGRGFWWRYVRRVHRGFDLLAPAPPVTTTQPIRRKPAAKPPASPASPADAPRFTHSKFGPGTLISRTGSGELEILVIRFDDGTTRKLLARFLTPVEP